MDKACNSKITVEPPTLKLTGEISDAIYRLVETAKFEIQVAVGILEVSACHVGSKTLSGRHVRKFLGGRGGRSAPSLFVYPLDRAWYSMTDRHIRWN